MIKIADLEHSLPKPITKSKKLQDWNGLKKEAYVAQLFPDQAEDLLRANEYGGQRKPSQARVAFLAAEMERGTYHMAQITLARLKDQVALLNGSQSLHAAVQSQKPLDCFITVVHCRNVEDLADLFAAFDNGGSRTSQHFAKAFAFAYGYDFDEMCLSAVSVTAGALELVANSSIRYTAGSKPADRAKNLVGQEATCRFVSQMAFAPTRRLSDMRHIRRQQVMASMIDTYRRNKKLARQFWTAVRDGAGLPIDSPALRLRDWLMRVQAGGSTRYSRKQQATAHAFRILPLLAWNEFRAPQQSLRFEDAYDIDMGVPTAV